MTDRVYAAAIRAWEPIVLGLGLAKSLADSVLIWLVTRRTRAHHRCLMAEVELAERAQVRREEARR